MDCCPHCNQVIATYDTPTINFRSSTVSFRGKTARLTPVQLEMFEYILDAGERGITKADVWSAMYQDRSDDDFPDWRVFDVRLCMIRKAFRDAGVELDFDVQSIRGRETRLWLATGRVPESRRQ